MPDWIDVSVPVRTDMPTWPDDPRAWVRRVRRVEDDDPANVSVVSIPTHAGTHVDPPRHIYEEGTPIDAMPPEVGLGPAHVLAVDDLDAVRAEHVRRLPDGVQRVLFKTDNSDRCWRTDDFVENYVHLTVDAAEALADRGVRLVGVDYLSVGAYGDRRNLERVHETLLGQGVWIAEGLDLADAPEGPCELALLPLKVEEGDGAPARAMVRPTEG
jgi:arylformamidase